MLEDPLVRWCSQRSSCVLHRDFSTIFWVKLNHPRFDHSPLWLILDIFGPKNYPMIHWWLRKYHSELYSPKISRTGDFFPIYIPTDHYIIMIFLLPSGNQTWQWKIHHLVRWFSHWSLYLIGNVHLPCLIIRYPHDIVFPLYFHACIM